METRILVSAILFIVSAAPAAYMVLHDTDKVKWFGDSYGFFGQHQWTRKYKMIRRMVQPPLNNWYYNFFKIRYREVFTGSATFGVSFTDCYHTCQLICRVLISVSIIIAIGAPWYFAGVIWAAYATVHAIGYKMLSR